MKKHIITQEEYEGIQQTAKMNQNKHVEKRLQVLIMRYEGATDAEIGKQLGYHRKRVSQLCAEYKQVGLASYIERRFGGNNRNMSEEDEKAFLAQFTDEASNAEITTVADIAQAYDEQTGKEHTSKSTVYYLLHKHGWRQITPQTSHPDKADEAEIEASKKLSPNSRK